MSSETFSSCTNGKKGYFWRHVMIISSSVCGDRTTKANHDLLSNPKQLVVVPEPNQTLNTALSEHKIEKWTERNQVFVFPYLNQVMFFWAQT